MPLHNPPAASGSVGYQVYTALLSQVETGAPTATVLENTLGGTPVWARSAQGIYTATLTGAFVGGKTLVLITANANTSLGSVFNYSFPNANVMQLRTFDNTMTASDDLMIRASLEIRVYP